MFSKSPKIEPFGVHECVPLFFIRFKVNKNYCRKVSISPKYSFEYDDAARPRLEYEYEKHKTWLSKTPHSYPYLLQNINPTNPNNSKNNEIPNDGIYAVIPGRRV